MSESTQKKTNQLTALIFLGRLVCPRPHQAKTFWGTSRFGLVGVASAWPWLVGFNRRQSSLLTQKDGQFCERG